MVAIVHFTAQSFRQAVAGQVCSSALAGQVCWWAAVGQVCWWVAVVYWSEVVAPEYQ